MILTLPVSHLINQENWRSITGIGALEYKKAQSIDVNGVTKLFHADYGIIQKGFIEYFDSITDFLIQNEIKLFSCDLGPAAEDVEVLDFSYQVKSLLLSKDKLEEIIYSKIIFVYDVIYAYNMNLLVHEYINSLPFKRVREIHISRPAIINGIYYDLHENPDDAMFELLDSVLQKVKEDTYVAVEYYKNFLDLVKTYRVIKTRYLATL